MSVRSIRTRTFGVCAAVVVALGWPAARSTGDVFGPDVIVHTLGFNFQKWGTVGGITAYSFTTTACNSGDVDAPWFSSGPQANRHPVIAQNMYRLKTVSGASRFEQIGMSWLKHGFCAADEAFPSCGACSVEFDCDWLTPGCTDTYDAFLNGQQFQLGPRSEVNPSTASFPVPWGGPLPPATIGRRLQVRNDDIDPGLNPGAILIGEGHYIAPDEPAWGTQFNNASNAQIAIGSFSGGGWLLSFSGLTNQQQAAIEAWPSYESGVGISNGYDDGRYILGYKVTKTGPTTWHYEYALFNMNSDRAGQAFSVPLKPGTTVSATGFHDIDYHSGEPYSLTDWTPTVSSGEVSWATELYEDNVDANALRWSTLYNFRLDCNRPPEPGNVTMVFFKPGSPATLDLVAAVPSIHCNCAGDLNGDGKVDGADIAGFTEAYVNGPFHPCADTALPIGFALNQADFDQFIVLLMAPGPCP